MRISTGNFNNTMLRVMQGSLQNLARTSDQLATGRRILQPSDDAIDTIKVLQLNNELTAIRQYEDNIASASGQLMQLDALYSSMNDLLLRARDVVLQAANGTQNDDNLASFATELETINETLLSLANYQSADGQYLFSGTTTTQKPVTLFGADYVYGGNNLFREVEVSGSARIQTTQPGDELFFDPMAIPPMDSIFDALQAASDELKNPITLSTVLSDTLTWIDDTSGRIGKAQTRGGSDLSLLDNIRESHGDISLFAEQLKSDLEAVDMIEATTRLSQQQTVLAASQQVYASIKQLSLFNYLT